MIRGLSQPVESGGDTRNPGTGQVRVPPASVSDNKVVGVLAYGTATVLAVHREQILSAVGKGVEQRPDAVWVCLATDKMMQGVLLSLGVEYVSMPLNAAWKRTHPEHGYDLRRQWAELELLHLCDELVVFHARNSSSQWRVRFSSGLHSRLFVVELGPEPRRRRPRPATAAVA